MFAGCAKKLTRQNLAANKLLSYECCTRRHLLTLYFQQTAALFFTLVLPSTLTTLVIACIRSKLENLYHK